MRPDNRVDARGCGHLTIDGSGRGINRVRADGSLAAKMANTFEEFVSHVVVLDTADAMVYLGRLVAVNEGGFVLEDADVHDCRDGHATKEVYVNDARQSGVSPNRRRVLVLRSGVISISRLEDVAEQ